MRGPSPALGCTRQSGKRLQRLTDFIYKSGKIKRKCKKKKEKRNRPQPVPPSYPVPLSSFQLFWTAAAQTGCPWGSSLPPRTLSRRPPPPKAGWL